MSGGAKEESNGANKNNEPPVEESRLLIDHAESSRGRRIYERSTVAVWVDCQGTAVR